MIICSCMKIFILSTITTKIIDFRRGLLVEVKITSGNTLSLWRFLKPLVRVRGFLLNRTKYFIYFVFKNLHFEKFIFSSL